MSFSSSGTGGSTANSGSVPNSLCDEAAKALAFTSPEGTYSYYPSLFPTSYLIPPISTMNASAGGSGVPISISMGMALGAGAMASGMMGGGTMGNSASSPSSSGTSMATSNMNTSGQLLHSANQLAQQGSGGQQAVAPTTPFGNQIPMYPMKATYVEMVMWGMDSSASSNQGSSAGTQGSGGGGSSSYGLGFLSRGKNNAPPADQSHQSAPLPTKYAASSSSGSDGQSQTATTSGMAGSEKEDADFLMSSSPHQNGMPTPLSSSATNEKRGLGSLGMGLGGFGGGRGSKGTAGPTSLRPKNNLRSTNSTFITRVQPNDQFHRLLQQPPQPNANDSGSGASSLIPPTGNPRIPPTARWVFLNLHRTLAWCMIDPSGKLKESIMRMHFSSPPTAHTVCEATKVQPGNANERLDLMVGFASGDLLWIDPVIGKYTRLNKGGIINQTPVIQIRYHPLNPNIIYVLHADGLLFTHDVSREDPPIQVSTVVHPWLRALNRVTTRKHTDDITTLSTSGADVDHVVTSAGGSNGSSSFPNDAPMFVWKNEEISTGKSSTSSPWAMKNPISCRKLSSKRVKGFEFSPDGQAMAVVSEDGTLKIVGVTTDKVLDIYAGYFGGLTCVTWSPDGRYILTGGQDDLITIFSPREGRVVARCQGHASFVTCIAFDRRKCNTRSYRFGSVGEDGRIILWDFSSASLQRPRIGAVHNTSTRRISLGSTFSVNRKTTDIKRSTHNLAVTSPDAGAEVDPEDFPLDSEPAYHPAPLRNEVAMLQPVSVKTTETTLLTSLGFFSDCIVTVARNGMVRVWAKPTEKSKVELGARGANALTKVSQGAVRNGASKKSKVRANEGVTVGA